MKRKILYINLDFPPMAGPAVWRALWFTKFLAASGYDVSVLCSDRSWWCERYDESILEHIPSSAKILRIKSLFPSDFLYKLIGILGRKAAGGGCPHSVLSRFNRLVDRFYPEQNFWWLLMACIRGIHLGIFAKFDCVITSGPPHISHIVGMLISRLSHARWIMDYRDLWLDDPIQSPGFWYQKKLLEFFERKAVKSCDAVVTVSPSWRKHLADKYEGVKHQSKFHMIRNGHNIEDYAADPRNQVDGRLHIHFNGAPQGLSKTTHLLDALSKLNSDGSFVGRMPLVTFTGMIDHFRDQVREMGLEEIVKDVRSMTYQQSIEYSKNADALLIIVNNEYPAMRGTIPAKTYEAMALGRHIFAVIPPESDIRELLEEYGNATACNVDDIEEIARCLAALIESRTELNRKVDVVRNKEFAGRFSRRRLTNQLIELIESLVAQNEGAERCQPDAENQLMRSQCAR